MLYHSDINDEKVKIDYIEALIDAFEQIDVNGDETLEWDEFSNYIVETGIARQKISYIDVIRKYHLSSVTKDKYKHDSDISKVFIFPQIKHLLVLENESKKLKVYNYLTGELINSFQAHSGSVICAEFLANQNLVVTSGSDNCLMFWKPYEKYKLINKIPTREIQLVVKWVNNIKLLVTAGFDNVINCYKKLEFEETGKFKNSIELISLKRLHNEIITDLLVIEHNNLIVACDLDGVITLWYLQNFENKYKLTGHSKGILSLSSIETKNLLLSCGYEHEIFIWDLIVGKKIASLQGHCQSLIGVKVLPGTFQIVSGDVSGIFKIWDWRNFSLVQTFSIPSNINKRANNFCVTSLNKKRIIIGADKVYFFDYEESQESDLADSKICISVMYNDVFDNFVTAHLNCIKIWDVNTGALKQVFRDITTAEISSIIFDTRKRKLFVGDVEGNVVLINILNGVQMKYFSKHKDYISSMAYYNTGKKFISASWDGFIKIHDDNSPEEKGLQLFELVQTMLNRINSCNSIDFNDKLEILASGYDNGNVTLINMKSLSSEGTLTDHNKVVVVKFLNLLPGVVVCDKIGILHFWSLIPTKPKKLSRDFTEENKSTNENNRLESFPVKCVGFEDKTCVMLTGDETGNIKAWNISEYVNYLNYMLPPRNITYNDKESHLIGSRESNDNFITKISNNYDENITVEKLLKYRDSLNIKAILLKSWKGHQKGVTSFTSHCDPVFYASSGMDCRVHIWNDKFEKIGSLTTIKDPHWNLKFDSEKKLEDKKKNAINKYTEIKEISYEDLFQGDLKIISLENDTSNVFFDAFR